MQMPTTTDTMPEKLNCNGVDVSYWSRRATAPSGQQPTLVFLHNAGTDHTIWMQVAGSLNEQFDTILVDWPGYGEDRGTPKGNSLSYYADVLSTFLEQLSLGPVILVGNCLGSGAALEYCSRHKPTDVQALALFNVLLPRTLGADGRFIVGWSKSKGQGIYEVLQKNIVVPKLLAGFIVRYQLERPARVKESVFQHLKNLNETPDNARNLAGLVGNLKESFHLDTLKMKDSGLPPTMVVWGKKNRVLPLSAGRSFVDNFCPDEFHVEDGGHLVMLELPQICAERIASFAGKVGNSRALGA
jgi:pimeloyl-ACP methyl ester carboxylesterase